jgi:hypothetical protein
MKRKCLWCDRDVMPFRFRHFVPLPSTVGVLPSCERFKNTSRTANTPHGPGLNVTEFRRMQAVGLRFPSTAGVGPGPVNLFACVLWQSEASVQLVMGMDMPFCGIQSRMAHGPEWS